ncbi:MAG: hypothetical protein RLN81_01680 [Balneolaceae bacterium]
MSYLDKITDIYTLLGEGKAMDAFEKYYHEDVVMIEATGERFAGKDENRKREEGFFGSIAEFHGAGVDAITSNEDNATTMVENWMEVTFQDGNRIKMAQIARQKWSGDHIIEERFYYNPNTFGA